MSVQFPKESGEYIIQVDKSDTICSPYSKGEEADTFIEMAIVN